MCHIPQIIGLNGLQVMTTIVIINKLHKKLFQEKTPHILYVTIFRRSSSEPLTLLIQTQKRVHCNKDRLPHSQYQNEKTPLLVYFIFFVNDRLFSRIFFFHLLHWWLLTLSFLVIQLYLFCFRQYLYCLFYTKVHMPEVSDLLSAGVK